MLDGVSDKRDRIITALDFPRLLMEQEIKQRNCSQHYRFDEQVEGCSECLYILECQGYAEQLAAPALQQASYSKLASMLRFGLEYVSCQLVRQDHETARCDCDLCGWIRSVTPLLETA